MNIYNVLLFFVAISLLGCQRDKTDFLQLTEKRLNEIETIKYEVAWRSYDHNGVELWNDTSAVYFDLREKEGKNLRYWTDGKYGKSIYNGDGFMHVDDVNKVLIVDDHKNFSPYNLIMYSLPSMKAVLPLLLNNENVTISEGRDTIVDGRKGINYTFLVKEHFIDWDNLVISNDFFYGEVFSSSLSLTIDKNTHLPILVVSGTLSAQNQVIIYKLNDIDSDYKEPNDLIWEKSYYADDYVMQTEAENRQAIQEKRAGTIGKIIDEWTLPRLSDDTPVDIPGLAGNVVLLEFWFKGCSACLQAIPDLNDIYEKYREKGLKMYGVEFVEQFPADVLRDYISENNKIYPNLYQGKNFANQYGISGGPSIMIIDRKGKIVYSDFGFDESDVTVLLDELLL